MTDHTRTVAEISKAYQQYRPENRGYEPAGPNADVLYLLDEVERLQAGVDGMAQEIVNRAADNERLTAEVRQLKLLISAGEKVVNDAANQAEARLHAEVEAEKLRSELSRLTELTRMHGADEVPPMATIPDVSIVVVVYDRDHCVYLGRYDHSINRWVVYDDDGAVGHYDNNGIDGWYYLPGTEVHP
jgi:hypothetical protein